MITILLYFGFSVGEASQQYPDPRGPCLDLLELLAPPRLTPDGTSRQSFTKLNVVLSSNNSIQLETFPTNKPFLATLGTDGLFRKQQSSQD